VPYPEAIPKGMETAASYTRRAAEPLLEQLAQLESQGQIADFELLPDKHAVRVTTTDPQTLSEIDGVEGILSADEAGLTCATQSAKAVRDTLEAAQAAQMSSASTQATKPSITVYYRGDYGSVRGQTDSNTTVKMVLKDASGAVKATETTTSSSSGYYSFYPDWQTCVGYNWYPEPGDTVEVTAGGNTVSMEVADISAFPDPTTNTVTGNTTPNQTVEVRTDKTEADCTYNVVSDTVTSGNDGSFSANLAGGFDRSVNVTVHVYDANENATYTYFYPPHIALDREGNPSGYLKPEVSYTAALIRGGSTVATFSGTTTEEGRYGGSFTKPAQTGDVIEVSGGGQVISTTFAALTDLTFDPTNNRITGNVGSAAADRSMRIEMDRPSYVCKDEDSCVTDTVKGNGDFAFDFEDAGFDLQRGDYDYGSAIYDAEGNYQEFRNKLVVPIVIAETRQDSIEGNWREPSVAVTMTLRSAGGAVKKTDTDTTTSYDAGFNFWIWGSSIEPGDRVDVTDGAYTLTISSVPTLTAYLDSAADTVSGTGPAGSLLAIRPYQFEPDPDYDHWTGWLCYTDTVSGGNYSVDFSGQPDAKARDYARVYHTTSDGHKVSARSYAFTVDVEKGGNHVEGYTPAPNTEVLIELWRGGSAQEVFTTTSFSEGNYAGSFSSGTLKQGDTVKVKPQGISTYSLSIPKLTVQEAPAQNAVKGHAPANAALKVELDQPATWYGWGVLTTADTNGDYVADFDGVYDYDCIEAQVGACTQPKTTYYNDDGHSVYIWGPEPADVSADAFEPDDVYTEATSYAGMQSHTFHTITDTDWISFTVTADEVGSVYYLQTTNLGVRANTKLYLYDTDGVKQLESDTSYSPAASEIAWTPSVSGTYYVEVTPYNNLHTEGCGSTYDFFIARHRVYLPLVMRNH
jgi:hypothetical protein